MDHEQKKCLRSVRLSKRQIVVDDSLQKKDEKRKKDKDLETNHNTQTDLVDGGFQKKDERRKKE